MSLVCTSIASNEREVPPTVNEVYEGERRGLMLSDRKASKVLGITVLRAPKLTIDLKASKVLGTAVVEPGVDWEVRVNGGSVDPRSRRRKGFLTKVTPLILGRTERERDSGKEEGQKVVLSPKWKSSRVLRRHTISYESGRNLLLPQAPSSPKSVVEGPNPTAQTFGELIQEDGGEGCDLALDSDTVQLDDSEMVRSVKVGVIPLYGANSCPPSPIDSPTPSEPHWAPLSKTTRGNPVLQKRREMIRSANKSVQILGVEVRRAILEKMENENEGRIGWSGV